MNTEPSLQYSICRETASINIPNKTHYFGPFTRTHNRVPSATSFSAMSIKRQDAQNRCYYELENCTKTNGAMYFVTLTFNDDSLIYYETPDYVPVDSHNPIITGLRIPEFPKQAVTNAFETMVKTFARKFGAKMSYCIAPEYGEGGASHNYKGKRGYANNPHLHVLISIRPLEKADENGELLPSTYHAPSEKQVIEIIRQNWQYTILSKKRVGRGTEIKYNHTDYKSAKFGHVDDGRHKGGKGPLVALNSTRGAVGYVAKYCTKDKQLVRILHDNDVKKYWTSVYNSHSVCGESINEYHAFMNENSLSSYPSDIIYDDYVGGVPTTFWTTKGNNRVRYFEIDESVVRPDILAYRKYHEFASSSHIFESAGKFYFYDSELLCDVELSFTNWILSSLCPFDIKDYFYHLDYRNPWHRLIIYVFYGYAHNTMSDEIPFSALSQNFYLAHRVNEFKEIESLMRILSESNASMQCLTEKDITDPHRLKCILAPVLQYHEYLLSIAEAGNTQFSPYYRYITPVNLDIVAGHYTKYFYERYIPIAIGKKMSEYHQNYVVKFHFSKGFGEYGMTQINDDGTFTQRDKHTMVKYPITPYYFRKYYYDWSICPISHNVRYTPNSRLILKRVNELPLTIDKQVASFDIFLSFLDLNKKVVVLPYLENALLSNHVETDASTYYDRFFQSIRCELTPDIIRKLVINDIVYRDRHYSDKYFDTTLRLTEAFDIEDLKSDYLNMLLPIETTEDNYLSGKCGLHDALLEVFTSRDEYNPTSHYPVLQPLVKYQTIFDIIRETYTLYEQEQKRKKYESKCKVIETLNNIKYSQLYAGI